MVETIGVPTLPKQVLQNALVLQHFKNQCCVGINNIYDIHGCETNGVRNMRLYVRPYPSSSRLAQHISETIDALHF